MRFSKTSIVLLPAVSALSEHAVRCLHGQAEGLSVASRCGDATVTKSCLAALTEGSIQSDIEQCLLNAGCSADDSALDASAIIYLCEDATNQPIGKELRRRQRGGSSNNNAEEEEETPTEEEEEKPANNSKGNANTKAAANTQTVNNKATPTEDEATPAQTVEDKAVEVTPATTTAATPARITGAQTVTDLDKPSQGTECYQTSTVTESICDPEGNCEERPMEKVKCLSGYLCRMDSKGQTTCMEKVNKLDTSGIIVSIIFASALVLSIGMMTYFCCRDRAQQKKLAAKAEAAAIAKASSAGTRARNVSDRQPLMTSQPGNTQGYGPEGGAPPQNDPFQDQTRY